MIICPGVNEMVERFFSKNTPLYLLIIVVASFAAYFNALFNGFVHDDVFITAGNYWIRSVSHIPEIFSKSLWSFWGETITTNYYRPLVHILLMIYYHIFGLNPWGYHLMNILFHAGVSSLVFILIAALLKEQKLFYADSYVFPSFVASLLFATHPIHTEVVTWVAGVSEVSFTFFYLLSFYLYIRSTSSDSVVKGSYSLSVVSFLLAVLLKETALTLPIILLLYDYILRKRREPLSLRMKRYIPYVLASGAYFVSRLYAIGAVVPRNLYAELGTYRIIINVLALFGKYVEKFFLPVRLNAFYVFHPIASPFEKSGILYLVIAVFFIAITCISWRQNKPIFFSLLFVVVPLLPALYIPGLGENVFAERYLYLPSIGFVFLVALLMAKVKASLPERGLALNIILVVLVGLYSAGTASRNTVWKNNYSLFSDMVEKSPDGATPHANLGAALIDKGQINEAIAEYKTALSLNPYYARVHINLGMAFIKKGLLDEAIAEYKVALTLLPYSAEAHNCMGLALIDKGFIDEGVREYIIALNLNPNYASAHNNLGIALWKKKGLMDKAVQELREAVRLDPDDPVYRTNLLNAANIKGWLDRALGQMKK